MSLQGFPAPATVSLQGFPATVSLQRFPATVSLQGFPATVSLQRFPATVSLQGFPAPATVSFQRRLSQATNGFTGMTIGLISTGATARQHNSLDWSFSETT